MFERYTEKARRVIFFSRYEASRFGSDRIETEHLLLGLLREDRYLRGFLTMQLAETLSKQVEESFSPAREAISTSVDLPLSDASKQVLKYAEEEAHEETIDCEHLLRGLLRIDCFASDALKRFGIRYETALLMSPLYAQKAERGRIEFRPLSLPDEATSATAPTLQPSVLRLESLIDTCSRHLQHFSEADAMRPLKREPWMRIEALGHLIDWAIIHHQWFSITLTEPKLIEKAYPTRELAIVQQYRECEWRDLIDLWIRLNRLLIHVISKIPENKLETPCRIGLDAPIPLSKLVANYMEHCEDLMSQILMRG